MRSPRHGWTARVGLLVVLVVLYLPLLQLMVNSVNANPFRSSWSGWTWRWFEEAGRDGEVRSAIANSLRLALASAVLSVLAGTCAVLGVRRSAAVRRTVNVVAASRVATPEILMAVGIAVLLPLLGVRYGFRAMLFGHVVSLSAYVVLFVGARAAQLDPRVEEAAIDLGARPLRATWSVVLPELAAPICAAALLTAAFSFDNVLLSLRLSGPADTTLPLVILSLSRRRSSPEIDAIGTIVVLVGVALCAGAVLVGRNLTRPSRGVARRSEGR